ncbi:hypothetical protein LJ737_15575 [Hymenobacter sp. 15J16-1T3B]|uniref:hypothetical protein n=1 Tax=Hymenobacter sp. 15J16-1T3B TaxID=2886941 RepID=UPI001D128C2D|nr:hypothetical protein [Hymenobacter sp. 15J16-1T3B]MCC3158666.1 hypothetical protein [Hymenobacter sp. 15J16-1T3B]
MSQATTPSPAEQLPLTAQRPASPAPTTVSAPALAAPAPARPATRRVRYWEQLDPASHSLYPVD